jgi:hypothetical protein
MEESDEKNAGRKPGLSPVKPHAFIPSYLTKIDHLKRSQYHTEDEVAQHYATTDAWVSVGNKVLDVTDLTDSKGDHSPEDRRTRANLAANAGKNISHWFKGRNCPFELRQYSNYLHGGRQEYFLPQGLIPDVMPSAPLTNYATPNAAYRTTDWWNQSSRQVGNLTTKMRKIYVLNTLFASEPSKAHPVLLRVKN